MKSACSNRAFFYIALTLLPIEAADTGTFTTRYELYSLHYTTGSKLTWKQISTWSYGKQDQDIGIKSETHTVVHLRVKNKGPKFPMLVEMNLGSTSITKKEPTSKTCASKLTK